MLLVPNSSGRPDLQRLDWVGARWTAAVEPSDVQRAATLQAAVGPLWESAKATRVHLHVSQASDAAATGGTRQAGRSRRWRQPGARPTAPTASC